MKEFKKEFKIAEFDTDYNSLLRIFYSKFNTRKEADEWCANASWSGADFMVLKEVSSEK